jgi:hypothetical protein
MDRCGSAFWFDPEMKRTWSIVTALACVLLGACVTRNAHTTSDFRDVMPQELNRAVEVGKDFARTHLGLTKDALDKLTPDRGMVMKKAGRDTILLQFYDPTVFPAERHAPQGRFIAMLGGFPSYFTVSIDAQTWQVVDHYACKE